MPTSQAQSEKAPLKQYTAKKYKLMYELSCRYPPEQWGLMMEQ